MVITMERTNEYRPCKQSERKRELVPQVPDTTTLMVTLDMAREERNVDQAQPGISGYKRGLEHVDMGAHAKYAELTFRYDLE